MMDGPKKPLHIGECIRSQLSERGLTTAWLARQLGYHRTTLYKLYDKRTIDTGILMHISRAMGYDFFSLYSAELRSDEV